MVEPILYAALGFLVATLLWLLFLPAFWRRAVRLTTKRLIDRLPVSASEIVASQDRLRAEHATSMRALERRAEESVAKAAQERLEAGRAIAAELSLKAEIDALKAELRTRDGEITRLTAALDHAGAEGRASAEALKRAREAEARAEADLEAARKQAEAASAPSDELRSQPNADIVPLRASLSDAGARTGAEEQGQDNGPRRVPPIPARADG